MPIYEEPLLSGQPPLLSGHLPVPQRIFVPVTYCFLFPSPLVVLKIFFQQAPFPSKPFAPTLCFFSGSHAGFALLLDTLLNTKHPPSPSFLGVDNHSLPISS